jgi:hypothetical protein
MAVHDVEVDPVGGVFHQPDLIGELGEVGVEHRRGQASDHGAPRGWTTGLADGIGELGAKVSGKSYGRFWGFTLP